MKRSDVLDLSIKYEVDKDKLDEALKRLNSKGSILFTMSGKMGSGKDTVGDLISRNLTSKGYKIINTSFGYLIRREIEVVIDGYSKAIDKSKYLNQINANHESVNRLISLLNDCTVYDRTDEARVALQFWGTEIRRKQKSDYWINQMAEFIADSVNKGYSINVTDARFPNEVKLIEDFLGKTIRLDVPEDIRIKRIKERDNIEVNMESFRHISETILDDYNFDRVFDGTKLPNELAKEGIKHIMN